ncbi:MAG: serine/threonine-protein phosphatase [Schwartzia sp.]|nr:serine/threonine-protein phosphatase [Schwartzia sp. (in: firmicutes)]
MEIRIGIARIPKHGAEISGDSCDIVERPRGGVSAILAEGQGSGRTSHQISRLAVNKATALITDGTTDSSVAKAVHEQLYDMAERRASSTLTILSADLESETLVISRNSHCPVIIWTEDYETVYDDEASPIGINRHLKTQFYELPFSPGMLAVTYTDGITAAGHKHGGSPLDFDRILGIIRENPAADAEYIARSIVEYALALDDEIASDDMTVVVLGITSETPPGPGIETMSVAYPYESGAEAPEG